MLKDLFDRLSSTYDQDVIECDNQFQFPFAGYQNILSYIAEDINSRRDFSQVSVLDLGIGTGILASKLMPERLTLYGIDISEKMLEIASLKLQGAHLFLKDFRRGIPSELSNMTFDYIVSTYAMHHLTDDEFADYLDYLVDRLNPFGKIFIGDVLFLNNREREICRQAHLKNWDDSEYYHVYDKIVSKLKKSISSSFMKMSFCAGILIFQKYHERTLQSCDSLVKY